MDTALIAGGDKIAASLGKLMVPQYYARFVHVPSASKTRQMVTRQSWGVAVICAPLPDENARALCGDLAHRHGLSVILLDSAAPEWGGEGFITLVTPVNRTLFEHTLRVLATVQRQLKQQGEENRRLAAKLEEARLVGRAKCALVAYRQMTEEQAHKYIERVAMDSRLPRREVARDILQVYDA